MAENNGERLDLPKTELAKWVKIISNTSVDINESNDGIMVIVAFDADSNMYRVAKDAADMVVERIKKVLHDAFNELADELEIPRHDSQRVLSALRIADEILKEGK